MEFVSESGEQSANFEASSSLPKDNIIILSVSWLAIVGKNSTAVGLQL
jgi:hypothetical protein